MCEISMNNQIEFYMTVQKLVERLSPNSAEELAILCKKCIDTINDVCVEYINNNNNNNNNNNKDFTVVDYYDALIMLHDVLEKENNYEQI